MISPDRMRTSHVTDQGRIDRFGTVCLERDTPEGRRRKDHVIRVHSPLLQRFTDGTHRVQMVGATLRVLDAAGKSVMTLSHIQLEPTGPETEAVVLEGGYAVHPKHENASVEDLERAAIGQIPSTSSFNEIRVAKVDPSLKRQRLIIFWLDEDYAVAFTPLGTPVPCTVEQPLSRQSWPVP